MTQRSFLVGTIGLCFYFISVTNGLPPSFSVLTWLALSLLVASGAVALLSLQGLKCRFRVARSNASAHWPASTRNEFEHDQSERAPQLEVQLYNGGTLNKTGLILTVNVRAEDEPDALRTRRFVIEALSANKNLTAVLPLDGLPRGIYQIEEILITGSDVLGLFRVTARYQAQRHGDGALRIAVSPAYLEAPPAIPRGGSDGARRGERGSDDELRGTRPFIAGDDLRAVHWKTTARLGRLVVREFDATSHHRTFIVWNGGASTRVAPPRRAPSQVNVKPQSSADSAVEQSLRFTMSLCAALSRRGDCALLRLDAKPHRVSSDAPGFLSRCGEALAAASADRITPPHAAGARLTPRRGGRGDAFFVVTHCADETLLHLVAAWRAQNAEVSIALVESDAPSPGASTRSPVSRAASGTVHGSGAALSGETLREYAAQLGASGARVVVVESGGNARKQVENTINALLPGHANRASHIGAANGNPASTQRNSVGSRIASKAREEKTPREVAL